MSDESVWICAYTEDPDEPDHHYDINVTEDGGLTITHRAEDSTTG